MVGQALLPALGEAPPEQNHRTGACNQSGRNV